jgi:hypothetical protein
MKPEGRITRMGRKCLLAIDADATALAKLTSTPAPPQAFAFNVTNVTSKIANAAYGILGDELIGRETIMTDTWLTVNEDDATLRTPDIADELLESAALEAEGGSFTLGSCTGLSVCPG